MSGKASIKINSIMQMIISISAVLISLITYPYLTRTLTPAGTGIVSFAQDVMGYFALVAYLGMPIYGTRTISKVSDNPEKLREVTSELFSISIFTHILALILLAITVVSVPHMRDNYILFVALGVAMLFNGIGPDWLYRGLERYTYLAIVTVTGKVLSAVGIFLFVKTSMDAPVYAWMSAIGSITSGTCNFLFMRKYIPGRIKLTKPPIAKHLKPVIVFFLISCASAFYSQTDVVMLEFMKSSTENGYYNVCHKVKTILMTISASLWTVSLPRAVSYWEEGNKEKIRGFVEKGLHVIFAVQYPLTIFFIVFSNPTVMVLGGAEYTQAIIPMTIILSSVFFIGLSNVYGGEVLVGMAKEKYILYANIVGAVGNIILNAVLIPIFSVSGASLATLFTEFIVLSVELVAIRRCTKMKFINWKNFLMPLLGTAIACAACVWLLFTKINCWIVMILAIVIFGIVYTGFMVLVKDSFVLEVFGWIFGFLKKRSGKH